jgi:hypothetical protein
VSGEPTVDVVHLDAGVNFLYFFVNKPWIKPMRRVESTFGRNHLVGLLAVGWAIAWCGSPVVRADEIDQKLLEHAPDVLSYLRGKGHKSVGVLKFRAKKGRELASDNVGTLNMTLANRLEIALALANSSDAKLQVALARNASAVAASLPGANHLNQEGRARLFEAKYPPAWGKDDVTPDAFVTGVAVVSDDLREMTVALLGFDRQSQTLERIGTPFTASTDALALSELGESYLLRGAFDHGNLELARAKAVESAAEVKLTASAFPLNDPNVPATLEARYDERPVPIDVRDGKGFLPEPQPGQRVSFAIKRTAKASDRLAVVLKVNGENTLFREKLPDLQCRKWILEPNGQPILVRGYQRSAQDAEEFRVASHEESKANEVRYGDDVGTVTITVFAEKPGKSPPSDLPSDTAEDLAALTRGIVPEQTPLNLAALKHQLRDDASFDNRSRGLILSGAQTLQATRFVRFTAEPVPVMSVTITYYKR